MLACYTFARRDSLASLAAHALPAVAHRAPAQCPVVLIGTKEDLRLDAEFRARQEREGKKVGAWLKPEEADEVRRRWTVCQGL